MFLKHKCKCNRKQSYQEKIVVGLRLLMLNNKSKLQRHCLMHDIVSDSVLLFRDFELRYLNYFNITTVY